MSPDTLHRPDGIWAMRDVSPLCLPSPTIKPEIMTLARSTRSLSAQVQP